MPTISRANWRVRYYWSESSGLKLGRCDYTEIRVIHNASVPFVYVNYAGDAFGPFTDELKSTSAKVDVRDIVRGFDLKVTYDGYGADYQYEHVWRFHEDGKFGSAIVIQGPGEELEGQHVYHVPFRFDLDISGASGDSFQRRGGSRWYNVAREGRRLPAPEQKRDFAWRVIDKENGRAALVRAGTNDDAELWALAYRRLESWSAWGAAGPGVPGAPGGVPAVYANGQSVQDTNIVLWYIAHVSARDLVAGCGPWFELRGYPPPTDQPEEDDNHGEPERVGGPG